MDAIVGNADTTAHGIAAVTAEARAAFGTLQWDDSTDNSSWPREWTTTGTGAWPPPGVGATGNRPVAPTFGYLYFDTTLNRLVTWDGNAWVEVNSQPPTPAPPTPAPHCTVIATGGQARTQI